MTLASEASAQFVVHTELFEGPLDLLLHHVRSREVPIEELPLADITASYLKTLEFLQKIDLEPASEFLDVAATLTRMKARSLLPRPETGADAEAAALEEQELLQRLVEHQVVRLAAEQLRNHETKAASVWFRGDAEPLNASDDEPQVLEADLFALVAAFRGLLEGAPEQQVMAFAREEFSVQACAEAIRVRLASGGPVPFEELFAPGVPRGKLIATFLALLDLIREADARAFQQGACGAIMIFPGAGRPTSGASETEPAEVAAVGEAGVVAAAEEAIELDAALDADGPSVDEVVH